MRQHVLSWYSEHGRTDLPWRLTSDPYHVYVSEIMLQQTQVASVKDRFYPVFLQRFPTLTALAAADEQDVLKAWQGLGYYRRAKYLHACAKHTAPYLPETIEVLIRLPGIGRYTAGAVRCFGHRKRAVMVDTNIKRVISRVTASELLSENDLYAIAAQWVPDREYYAFNQALLDIGATICTAKNAACLICPLSAVCEGKGAPYAYPVAAAKKTVPERVSAAAIMIDAQRRVALCKRDTAFLGGYYTLPVYTDTPDKAAYVDEVTQTYSHFKARIRLYHTPADAPGIIYVTEEDAHALPLSAIDKKMVKIAFEQ